MDMQSQKEMHDLLVRSLDGSITEAQTKRLNEIVNSDARARQYCIDFYFLATSLRRPELYISTASSESQQQLKDLQEFARYEIAAEIVKIPQPVLSDIAVEDVKTPRKINKIPLVTTLILTAAMVLLMVWARFTPVAADKEVATLTDSLNAVWADHDGKIENEKRLSSGFKGSLTKGYIKLRFDNHAGVVIEAPADFQIAADNRIVLNHGRLYATVPQEATGFTVTTHNSRIIDLGTEFGVYSDSMGDTELHVFRGKTKLVAGINNNVQEVIDVLNGHARQVNHATQKIRPIELSQGVFARDIDSQTHRIWRGETLDLADMVCGGNGFQTGQNNGGIDWNGRQCTLQTLALNQPPKTGATIPVSDNPFIDCLFVPAGTGQAYVTLTSRMEELNLDDFIRQDTNGLITLMLVHDISDSDNHYWFSTKETKDDSQDMLPALILPAVEGQSARVITTAHQRGADTYITNDLWQSGDSPHGTESIMMVRHFQPHRIEIAMLRFDISDLAGRYTGAMLRLHLSKGTRQRNLHVYGLKDGPDDNWDENTVCYATAPGLAAADSGSYKLDTNRVESLGTFPVVDISIRITRDGRIKWSTPDFAKLAPYTDPAPGYPVTSCGTISREENGIREDYSLTMSDIRCGTPANPSILLAANGGITFDLDAIRAKHGNMRITSFSATCGLARAVSSDPASTQDPAIGKANIYLLVNGSERFSAIDKTPADQPQSFRIELTGNDKYLTLISTQGSDGSNQNDYCIFLKPTLFLEP